MVLSGPANAQGSISVIESGGSDELVPPPSPTCDDLVFLTEVTFTDAGIPLGTPRLGVGENLVTSHIVTEFEPIGPSIVELDEVITFDGHAGRDIWPAQLNERVRFEFLLDGEVQATTPFTPDLPDDQVSAWLDLDMGSYELPNGADALRIVHYNDPDNTDSVVVSALCGKSSEIPESTTTTTVVPDPTDCSDTPDPVGADPANDSDPTDDPGPTDCPEPTDCQNILEGTDGTDPADCPEPTDCQDVLEGTDETDGTDCPDPAEVPTTTAAPQTTVAPETTVPPQTTEVTVSVAPTTMVQTTVAPTTTAASATTAAPTTTEAPTTTAAPTTTEATTTSAAAATTTTEVSVEVDGAVETRDGEQLAVTGSDDLGISLIAVGLVLVGSALLLQSKDPEELFA